MPSPKEETAWEQLDKSTQKHLLRAAQKIHANTGHRNVEAIARLLRQKGAPLTARAAMEKVKCSACEEHRKQDGGPPATWDSEQIPWITVGIDLKDYNDGEFKYKFLVMVDEATRLARVALLFAQRVAESRNATTGEVVAAFLSTWCDAFGTPASIRHDPEGALMSAEILAAMSKLGVKLAPTAGEAHG